MYDELVITCFLRLDFRKIEIPVRGEFVVYAEIGS